VGDHLGTLGAVRFFPTPSPKNYKFIFFSIRGGATEKNSKKFEIFFIPPPSALAYLIPTINPQPYDHGTLSECLFLFGIYSFHSGGLGRLVFQFLEAATPSLYDL
jgi:hypothetical protein